MTASLRAGALGLLLLAAPACQETTDPNLVVDVGLTLLALVDTGLRLQNVDPSADFDSAPIQVAQWEVESALFLLPGNAVDLTFGETCRYTDSVSASTVVQGNCLEGVVIQATAAPLEVSLRLRVRPAVVRAEPVPWERGGGDFDGDGVPDVEDNCPLLQPSDQTDADRDGIGDLCSRFDSATGLQAPDNDGDGIIDRRDNCVWKPNPNQENTTGVGTESGIPDSIGDACGQQTATLEGGAAIEILLPPTTFQQPLAGGTFLVVDFRSDEGLECTWSQGTCVLDAGAVRFCSGSSALLLALGCP